MTSNASRKDDLQIVYVARGRRTWGTRIHADGKSEELEGSKWEELVQLEPAELDDLREVVRKSGYFDVPATVESSVPVDDGARLSWSITLGKREHSVTVEPGASHETLKRLDEELQRVIGEALNRVADASYDGEAEGED